MAPGEGPGGWTDRETSPIESKRKDDSGQTAARARPRRSPAREAAAACGTQAGRCRTGGCRGSGPGRHPSGPAAPSGLAARRVGSRAQWPRSLSAESLPAVWLMSTRTRSPMPGDGAGPMTERRIRRLHLACRTGLAALALLLLACPQVAWAADDDVVTIKSGERLVGEIKRLQKDVLTLSTPFSDSDFAIKWGEIVAIESPRLFLVETYSGQRLSGSLQAGVGQPPTLVIGGVESDDRRAVPAQLQVRPRLQPARRLVLPGRRVRQLRQHAASGPLEQRLGMVELVRAEVLGRSASAIPGPDGQFAGGPCGPPTRSGQQP